MQPGVLVGLNSLLEQEGSITLPTGEVIQRHPDTAVVVTTNVTYEGCRGLNQSVIDRMSLVRDVELPSNEIMAERAMNVTGATDEVMVSQMVQVVTDMADFCRKNGISDGSVMSKRACARGAYLTVADHIFIANHMMVFLEDSTVRHLDAAFNQDLYIDLKQMADKEQFMPMKPAVKTDYISLRVPALFVRSRPSVYFPKLLLLQLKWEQFPIIIRW